MAEKKLIDLYPYRLNGNNPEYLLFERAAGHMYEGQWRMIGGKVKDGEFYWQAALRELKEETGVIPVTFWTIPGINQFYEHKTDQIHHIPAFAAEIGAKSTITLDDEHTRFQWLPVDKAVHVILWPEQRRLLQLVNHILTSNQILEDWLVPAQ